MCVCIWAQSEHSSAIDWLPCCSQPGSASRLRPAVWRCLGALGVRGVCTCLGSSSTAGSR